MACHGPTSRHDVLRRCCDVAVRGSLSALLRARFFFREIARLYYGRFPRPPSGGGLRKRPVIGGIVFWRAARFFVLGPETYESVVCQSFDPHYIQITCFMLKTYMLHTSYRASSSITSCHARTHSCEESRAHRPAGLNDDKNDAKHGVLTSSSKRTEN